MNTKNSISVPLRRFGSVPSDVDYGHEDAILRTSNITLFEHIYVITLYFELKKIVL